MLSIRYLYTTGMYEVAANLYATIERQSDGFFWDDALGTFSAAPSLADRTILLAQRIEEEYSSVYEAEVLLMGDPGHIQIWIHDADLDGDIAIDRIVTFVHQDDEITLMDILFDAQQGAINPLAIVRPVSQLIVMSKVDIGPGFSNAQTALDAISSAITPYRARIVRNFLERGELHMDISSPLQYQASVAKVIRGLYPSSRDSFHPPPDTP